MPQEVILQDSAGNLITSQAHTDGWALLMTSLSLPGNYFGSSGEVIAANGANIDLWPGAPGIATQPEKATSGFTPNVISSSGSDAVGGAGVDEVMFSYIKADGTTAVGTLAVTGVTQNVHATITDCIFINYFWTSGLDGAIVAAGNIDIRNSTTVMARILATGNWGDNSMKVVPAGRVCHITGWNVSSSSGVGGKQAIIRLRTTALWDGTSNMNGRYLFKNRLFTRDNSPGQIDFDPVVVIPAGGAYKASTWTSGATDAGVDIFAHLEDA